MKKLFVLALIISMSFVFFACGDDDEVEQRTTCGPGGVFIDGAKVIAFTEPGNCEGMTALQRDGSWGNTDYDCIITSLECNGGTALSYYADCGENGSCNLNKIIAKE